jgi:hypothetical protein
VCEYEAGKGGKMDDYMFNDYVRKSKTVVETTSYLEIFSYSVGCRSWTSAGIDVVMLIMLDQQLG